MLYRIQDGTVSLGGETVFSHINFEVRGNEKIALVGKNGSGKTTLLRLLAGELSLDRDDKRKQAGIYQSRDLRIGLLAQHALQSAEDADRTVEEVLLEACPCPDTWDRDRFLYEQEYDRLFTGFGFQKKDKEKRLGEFSGGQRTRIALIRLMLEKPDLLLLDEPTNHLDQEMCEWLEGWIKQYEKAVVIVSHDRYFLDETAQSVYEISEKKLVRYAGNYSAFVEQKQKQEQIRRKEWEQQQAEIERLNALIVKFRGKPRKAAFARSRQKLLDRMEQMEKPSDEMLRPVPGTIEPEVISAKWVLEAEELQIGYDQVLLELNLRIRRGQKNAVIGPNGIGKSTFLKTAAGLLPPLKGKCALGQRVTMEYFDQHTASMLADCSVKDHFHRRYPSLTEQEVRSILGRFLFRGKDTAKCVKDLSGGEKSRLIFAEIFQSCPNFMILDEPTNHMDILAKEMLESLFRSYQGTLLFVSHDRYFIEQVADALLVFEKDHVMYYPFHYRHYRKKLQKAGELPKAFTLQQQKEVWELEENQVLLEELRNVPEAEKGRFRSISTEQAYQDWRKRLMCEELEQIEAKIQQMEKVFEQQEQIEQLVQLGYPKETSCRQEKKGTCWQEEEPEVDFTEEAGATKTFLQEEQSFEWISEEFDRLQELWTQKCLEWNVFLEEEVLIDEG